MRTYWNASLACTVLRRREKKNKQGVITILTECRMQAFFFAPGLLCVVAQTPPIFGAVMQIAVARRMRKEHRNRCETRISHLNGFIPTSLNLILASMGRRRRRTTLSL